MSGRLDLILGCMFAGKTGEFISRYRKYKGMGREILVINHSSDKRYGKGVVSTHDRDKITCMSSDGLLEISTSERYIKADIIMIEEAQFFTDLVEFVQHGMDIDRKHFIVCGLSGDCFRRPFGEILDLIPLCTDITHLKALCVECDREGQECPAVYSMRKTSDKRQTVVGAADTYFPVCHRHYMVNYFDSSESTDKWESKTKNTTTTTGKMDTKSNGSVGDTGSEWMLWGC